MSKADFKDFTHAIYSLKNSGTARSYIKAIEIMDDLFKDNDIFNLQGKSLCDIEDLRLATKIVEYIRQEEAKYRDKKGPSFFTPVNPKQDSYPGKRFCTGAIALLLRYVEYKQEQKASEIIENLTSGKEVGKRLNEFFEVNKTGEDIDIQTTTRRGQHYFRQMLLKIYDQKCCLTGLDVPEVLRASHISAWADDHKNRMNPENGLCLSATYDAAFDKHLISFDEEFRMILSPRIRDHYTSEAFREYFLKLEGHRITLPQFFIPDQELLSKHRNLTI